MLQDFKFMLEICHGGLLGLILRISLQSLELLFMLMFLRNEKGRSRGFGTVKFASEADMNSAIKALDGSEFNGRIISVRKDKFQE
jgi:RNA recognition motif-containing protein